MENPRTEGSASGGRRLGLSLRRPRVSDLVTVLLVVVLIAGVLEIIPSNYYMLLPGQARSVAPMIHVQGAGGEQFKGTLYMTDVSIYKVDHKLEEIYGRVNPNADLEPTQSVAGNLSEKQYLRANALLMTDSIQEAEIAALSTLGRYRIGCAQMKPQIQGILAKTPAARVLKPGDFIERISGQPVCKTTDVSRHIRNLKPGQRVHLRVLSGHRVLDLNVPTIPAVETSNGLQPSPRGKLAMVGIQMGDAIVPGSVHLPVKVHVDPGNTVGPSAGLMFTLGIIEQLQHRDLARGCKVAGTGTVDYQGNVGEIGGAKQKIIAARNAGAKYFLVPNVPDNVNPARAHRGSVTVIPVSTVGGALAALSRITPCR